MACHPDLVIRSKNNKGKFVPEGEVGEATVCRLCNDIAEDAIQAKCRHIFDRECMRQYLDSAIDVDHTVRHTFFNKTTLLTACAHCSLLFSYSPSVQSVICHSPSTWKVRHSNWKRIIPSLRRGRVFSEGSTLTHGGRARRSRRWWRS